MSDFVHERHKPPTALQRTRPLVVACPQMRSNVNLSRIVRAASCCGVTKLIACGSGKVDAKIARDGATEVTIDVRRSLPPVLQKLSREALSKDRAFLAGDIIGPGDPIVNGSQLKAIFITTPIFYPDSFSTYVSAQGQKVHLLWLIPITAREAEYIRSWGKKTFEDKLRQFRPDISDFSRQGMLI